MRWFDRWFQRQSKKAWEQWNIDALEKERHENMITTGAPRSPIDSSIDSDSMDIRIYGATGGQVIEFRRYDRHKDRTDNKLYVIPAEQNYTESFSKIVNMEMLR